MSTFSFYLDQIRLPSWWGDTEPLSKRKSPAGAEEKRGQVLTGLRMAAKPVSATWLIDFSGYTKQSVMHILYALVEQGLVQRIDGDRVVLWRAK